MADVPAHYAFPHAGAGESAAWTCWPNAFDPVTKRRIGLLGLAPDVRCLEIGGGRGSIARWLARMSPHKARSRSRTWRPASCQDWRCRI
jgi:hypothetical protein